MKSSKLITRKALTQLMLAMVASGKAHRSDFETMNPNDIVLSAANLIDPSEAYVAYTPLPPVNHIHQDEPETEVAEQFVWKCSSLEKVYRYLQLTMDDTEEDSPILGPYSSYDAPELLCLFFDQGSHWHIRGELYSEYGFESESDDYSEFLEYLASINKLPDVQTLFEDYVFYTDASCAEVIDEIEAEVKEQNQSMLIEATAKLLYVESSATVNQNALVANGIKSTSVKNMSPRKRRQLAWELNCCVERENFIDLAHVKLGISRG